MEANLDETTIAQLSRDRVRRREEEGDTKRGVRRRTAPVAPDYFQEYNLDAASVVDNRFIYVMGGRDRSTLDTAEKYDPVQDRWTPIASMGSRRSSLASVVNNGFIYVMGG
eukprot:COSAG02_NODE_18467_length_936_cov_1.437276_1_plen_111_part_00